MDTLSRDDAPLRLSNLRPASPATYGSLFLLTEGLPLCMEYIPWLPTRSYLTPCKLSLLGTSHNKMKPETRGTRSGKDHKAKDRQQNCGKQGSAMDLRC